MNIGDVAAVLAIATFLAFLGLVGIANAGPYTSLDCRDGGYHITQRGGSPTLKHPDKLCEEKRDSISPTLFDAKVAIEHALGMGDYTWSEGEVEEEVPDPEIYLWPLGKQDTPNQRMSCEEAAQWVEENPNVSVGIKVTNFPIRYRSTSHPANAKLRECYRQIESARIDGMEAADV